MILNIEIKLELSPIPAKKEEENMKKKRTKYDRKKEEMNERQGGQRDREKEDRGIEGIKTDNCYISGELSENKRYT